MSTQNGNHHHGLTIRTFRNERHMAATELAELWPSGPVSTSYIHSVEAGRKQITDQNTLRGLSDLLDIPLWRFGLSEYNPFNPHEVPGHGERMFNETLDLIERLVEQTWYMRRVAPVTETARSAHKLLDLYTHLARSLPPTAQLEKRFLRLYAQVQRLHAIMLIEQQQYVAALAGFHNMLRTAEQLGEPGVIALALMGVGTELERAGKPDEAVERLKAARDVAFSASKQVATLVNAYLARAYASSHDTLRFQRTIETAQTVAEGLGARYGDGTDQVFHRLSGVLAERSYGYLEIGAPDMTLAMQQQMRTQIAATDNRWLDAWIYLDWARAYKMIGEIEECVRYGRDFFSRASKLQTPHAIGRARHLLVTLEQAGYGDEHTVREFREEMLSTEDRKRV